MCALQCTMALDECDGYIYSSNTCNLCVAYDTATPITLQQKIQHTFPLDTPFMFRSRCMSHMQRTIQMSSVIHTNGNPAYTRTGYILPIDTCISNAPIGPDMSTISIQLTTSSTTKIQIPQIEIKSYCTDKSISIELIIYIAVWVLLSIIGIILISRFVVPYVMKRIRSRLTPV